MPPPQGQIVFAGVNNVLTGSFTLRNGIQPSTANLRVVGQQAPFPSGPANLLITYGNQTIQFPNCVITGVRQEGRANFTVTISDRRWRWRYGSIFGHYNQRDGQGVVVPSTQKTTHELVQLLMTEMGEPPHVANVPLGTYPEMKFRGEPPAVYLQRLCNLLQCRIVYNYQINRFEIHRIGFGGQLALQNVPVMNYQQILNTGIRPRTVRVIARPVTHEVFFSLEPVGIEPSASNVPDRTLHIDQLSYRPTGGWNEDDWQFTRIMDDTGTENLVRLARQCVYRWYRIKAVAGLTNFDVQLRAYPHLLSAAQAGALTLQDILPIYRTPLTSGGAKFDPWILGLYKHDGHEDQVEDTGQLRPYDSGWSINHNTGVVKFGRRTYRMDADDYVIPADLYLAISFTHNNPATHSPYHFFWDVNFQAPIIHNVTHSEVNDSIRPRVTHAFLDNAASFLPTNTGGDGQRILYNGFSFESVTAATNEATQHATYWWQGLNANQQTVEYVGLQQIFMDADVSAVTWSIRPMKTRAARGMDFSVLPSIRKLEEKERNHFDLVAAQRALEFQQDRDLEGASVMGALNDSAIGQQRWLAFENVGSQSVPAYGVMEVVGSRQIAEAHVVIKCQRPSEDNLTEVAINGPAAVAVTGYGRCTMDLPVFVLYDTGSTPQFGEDWGTQADSFLLKKDSTGMIAGGLQLTTPDRMIVLPTNAAQANIIVGKSSGTITPRIGNQLGSGLMTVYEANATGLLSAIAPSLEVTVYNLAPAPSTDPSQWLGAQGSVWLEAAYMEYFGELILINPGGDGGGHYIQAASSAGITSTTQGGGPILVSGGQNLFFTGNDNPSYSTTPVKWKLVENAGNNEHVLFAWVEGAGTFSYFNVSGAVQPDSLNNPAGGSETVNSGDDLNFIGDKYFETGGLENRIPIYSSIVSALGVDQVQQWADGKDIAYTFEAESNPGDRGVNPGGTADIEPRRTLQWLPTERTNERVPVWANIEESVPNNTTYLSVWIDYTDLSFQFFIDGDTGAGVTVDNQDTVSFIGQLLMTDDGQGVIRVNALGAEIVEIILNLGEVQGFDNTTNQILGHLAGQLRWLTINDCQV